MKSILFNRIKKYKIKLKIKIIIIIKNNCLLKCRKSKQILIIKTLIKLLKYNPIIKHIILLDIGLLIRMHNKYYQIHNINIVLYKKKRQIKEDLLLIKTK